ncbi:hypothetical protein [Tropicimonas sp. IMCC34011]|uniref:hypothetical protein n=1 Tax=Tropicimonas sp. IMCC34011 TaxID=2248759 RepID=UPI000E288A5F|nr:hypothetical protein [Tropicimonas sp. IMCC34011]
MIHARTSTGKHAIGIASHKGTHGGRCIKLSGRDGRAVLEIRDEQQWREILKGLFAEGQGLGWSLGKEGTE